MLNRVYIDNFRCLVNFEIKPGIISLLLGENGSGKSTLFDVLSKLKQFINGQGKVDAIFSYNDLCRWQTTFVQTFELDVAVPDDEDLYRYRLVIEFTPAGDKVSVQEESLTFAGQPLFEFTDGTVQLYRDDHSLGPKYPFDWSASGLASILPRPDNTHLTKFKEQLRKLIIVQLVPPIMVDETDERGDTDLNNLGDNFAGWYFTLSQDQGLVSRLNATLGQVLAGFDSFKFEPYGKRYLLLTRFDGSGAKNGRSYRFSELSDGQRMLIALYAILEEARNGGYILCLDEPENFVSLPEVQPWLNELRDVCDEHHGQAVLISHHPELIDLLSGYACWFNRQDGLSTRLHDLSEQEGKDLRMSELIARRWI